MRRRTVPLIVFFVAILVGAGIGVLSRRVGPGSLSSDALAVNGPPRVHTTVRGTHASQHRPPRFVGSEAASEAAERTPGSPSYDPFKLRGILPARAIFRQEPRDENWAPSLEKFLKPELERDLQRVFGGVVSTIVECRTAVCKFHLDSRYDFKIQSGVVRALYPGSFYENDWRHGDLYTVYSGGLLADVASDDPAALTAELQRNRALQVAALTQGRFVSSDVSAIPAETWRNLGLQ
jgi:hypothetical protein